MAAGKHNIIIQKKATFRKDFTLYSTYISEGHADNVPISLAGCTITAKIRKKVTDTSPIISFTASVVSPAADGKLRIELSAAQTAALNFETGVYDILVTYPSTEVDKVIEGVVVLDKTVS